MSARYFCDVCDQEIVVDGCEIWGVHTSHVRGRIVNINISSIAPAGGGGHDICKSCALDALAKLDDRPGVSNRAEHNHGQLEQLTADFVEEMDKLSNRNYQLRMENEELKSRLQGDPAAARFDFDGDGYQYIDSGSGSDWMTRKPGAELLYLHPPAQPKVPDALTLAVEFWRSKAHHLPIYDQHAWSEIYDMLTQATKESDKCPD